MQNPTATPAPAPTVALDLTAYDVVIVSSSGGKDSQAMLHHVAQVAKAQGVLDRVHVAHADLGRAEWVGTDDVVARQADAYGLPLHVVSRTSGDFLTMVEQRREVLDAKGKTDAPAWPSSSTRQCTSDLKRGPLQTVNTALAQAHPAYGERPVRVLECIGLRAQESPARAKKEPLTRNTRSTGKGTVKVVDTWLPILNWTEDEVWQVIREAGTPVHPAYAAGLPRASCVFCIMAPKHALLKAAMANLELADEYAAMEEQVRSTFRQDTTMADLAAEAREALAEGREVEVTEGWCSF